nr:SIN3-HDAC complex-associated factor isoform X3 [Camelus dromedarius]
MFELRQGKAMRRKQAPGRRRAGGAACGRAQGRPGGRRGRRCSGAGEGGGGGEGRAPLSPPLAGRAGSPPGTFLPPPAAAPGSSSVCPPGTSAAAAAAACTRGERRLGRPRRDGRDGEAFCCFGETDERPSPPPSRGPRARGAPAPTTPEKTPRGSFGAPVVLQREVRPWAKRTRKPRNDCLAGRGPCAR